MTEQTYAGLILDTVDVTTEDAQSGYRIADPYNRTTYARQAIRCPHGYLIPIDKQRQLPITRGQRVHKCYRCDQQWADGEQQNKQLRALLKTMGSPRKQAAARGVEEPRITYWRNAGDQENYWHVGQWGPRYLVRCEENDVRAMVDALNAAEENAA